MLTLAGAGAFRRPVVWKGLVIAFFFTFTVPLGF